ncbi:hypothetical protein Syncc9605_2499 [Synechococcus sp. CC9605]|nr:hypothetical protein Syncc9605_2499 [Synechococcus sp. CC9605]
MPSHSHPEKNLALNRPRQPSFQAMPPFSVFERSSPKLLNWLKSTGVTGTIQGSTRLIQEGEQQLRLLMLLEGEPTPALHPILSGSADILVTLSEVNQVVGSTRRGELLRGK